MISSLKERINQLSTQVPVNEDSYWLFFGHGEGWGNKCTQCMNDSTEESLENNGPFLG